MAGAEKLRRMPKRTNNQQLSRLPAFTHDRTMRAAQAAGSGCVWTAGTGWTVEGGTTARPTGAT